jgi:hypothetical protein
MHTALRAIWEFVVGDDWRVAIGVALALALTAIVAGTGASAWWVMPLAVIGLLALSIRRATRQSLGQGSHDHRPVTTRIQTNLVTA